ncbi:MAG: DUF6513 domain-containing protein [Thiohalobacteraceae bacterium]
MSDRILFLTGRLAEANLNKVLESMQPTPFQPVVHQLGLSVAGLMTVDMIRRRLRIAETFAGIVVPGRCRGDLTVLEAEYGIPVTRGPEELKDLPYFFGQESQPPVLDHYDIKIFAEIVDAPQLTVEEILDRAETFRRHGADVIDLGCLPDTAFPHLEDAVTALRAQGLRVSVDSMEPRELVRGGLAGAEFLLSLQEDTLWVADEVASTPVLIPARPGDLDSLLRAMEQLDRKGRHYLADPILDPLLIGFTDSILRYHELRARRPDVDILLGIGNVTELTDADTAGINAVLMGMATELGITHVLTTQVSPHARRAIREGDIARRMMYYARTVSSLPRNIHSGLLALHERRPYPYSLGEIQETAAAVRDPSYRVQVSEEGIHIYNRDGLVSGTDPFTLYPKLAFAGDVSHAFYMGTELARAQIAWQLGKRYTQDQELNWGCAVEQENEDRQGCLPALDDIDDTGTGL